MDANSIPTSPGKKLEKNQRKRRRKKEAKKKALVKNGLQPKDQIGFSLEGSENVRDSEVTSKVEKNFLDNDLTLQQLGETLKMDAGSKIQLPDENHAEEMDELEKNLLKDIPVQPVAEHPKFDVNLMSIPRGKNFKKNQRRNRKKKEAKKKAVEEDGPGTKDEKDCSLETSENRRECEVINYSEKIFLDKDLTLQPLAEIPKLDVGSTENPSEGKEATKDRKKRKRIKKKKADKTNEVQSMLEMRGNTETTENLMVQTNVKTETTGTLSEGKEATENIKKRRRIKKKKADNTNEVQSMLQMMGNTEITKNLMVQTKVNTETTGTLSEGNLNNKRKREKKRKKKKSGESNLIEFSVSRTYRRKLLVLDLNGLLAHIIMPAPKGYKGVVHILRRAIFKRPFCDDFLEFCFQNFDVGVWSSRSKRVFNKVVEYLLGDLRDKLVFCWDMSHCTQTGFKSLENKHKLIVFKELRKIWENDETKSPWKKGDYDESNTLLLDDSPYKSLLNPAYNAIFPSSYHYEVMNDNSLGPGGDLRVYLEGLLKSDNVQKYVEQHPFGQGSINETNSSWEFYSRVLQSIRLSTDNTPSSLPT